MIDLTPLDVRKKRGDFKKSLRGYDPLEVDGFLELVAERMEELVKANITLEERAQRLGEQVVSLGGRERAVNEALVTAQQLRDEIRGQAQREADQVRREAEREVAQLRKEAERDAEHLAKEARLEAKGLLADAERQLEERKQALAEMEAQRTRFLESYRQLLHRQIEMVQVEENRSPLDEVAVELDLGGGRRGGDGARPALDPGPAADATPVAEPAVDPDDGLPVDAAPAEAAPVEAAPDEADTARIDREWAEVEAEAAHGLAEVQAPVVEGAPVEGALDDDDAMPVEGLAPSADELDEMDSDATILPHPGSNARSMAEAGTPRSATLQELLEDSGDGAARDG